MTKLRTNLLLIVLLFSSLFIRLYKLSALPLFGDELDVGYQAYSLLTTGKDYMGQTLPVYLHSLSEWRAPLLIYTTVPSIFLFGLSEFSVRLPPVVFGVISIYLLFKLVLVLTRRPTLALCSAFVLAFSPWHLHYSRTAFESTLLLTLILFAVLSSIKGRYSFSALAFALALYTYNTANVFVPLLLVVLALTLTKLHSQKITLQNILVPVSMFVVLSMPLLFSLLTGQAGNRFSQLAIFTNPKTIDNLVTLRTTGLTQSAERVFHNKLTGWGGEFLTNYSQAFSPAFLFFKGDPNPRHTPPGFGLLAWFCMPLFAVGLLQATTLARPLKILFLGWLFVSPVPAALTVNGGEHATRLFVLVPALAFFTAHGLLICCSAAARINRFFGRYLVVVIIGFVFVYLTFWLHTYFVHYTRNYSHYWHGGYKEAMQTLGTLEDHYSTIVISGSEQPPLLPFLFWTKKSPKWFQQEFGGDRYQATSSQQTPFFPLGEKYIFVESLKATLLDTENLLKTDTLYFAVQEKDVPGDWDWRKTAPRGVEVLWQGFYPDGRSHFYLFSFKPPV